MEDETLATLRYCFQRILVPIVVVIGVLGNLVTVAVLTRRRMRCSTNIYLTALAVADIVYLLFIFVLSLQHYPNINHSKYRIYWSTFGLSHWFCDASSYTSIYLTVSFTIERYIAVCHPIRGQFLCTESRAKRVIAAVAFLCFFLTISTAFEYKLSQETVYIDKDTHENCEGLVDNLVNNETYIPVLESFMQNTANNKSENDLMDEGTKYPIDDSGNTTIHQTFPVIDSDRSIHDRMNSCMMVHYIYANQSDFGQNEVYKEIFYILSSTFATFVPLILLATFNCFLVAAVHRSHKVRHKMTNKRQCDTSTAQENKVTVTLIAVVVLFLVCQTPGAVQLIYTMKAKVYTNLDRALNNLCNFLVTLNAACNFILYCALSDKYRKTVKELFLGRLPMRTNTITSSRYVSGTTTMSSVCNTSKSPNTTRNSIVLNRIKPAAKKNAASNQQFSISPEEYASLKDEVAKEQAISQSIRKGSTAARVPLLNRQSNNPDSNNRKTFDGCSNEKALLKPTDHSNNF